MIRAPSASDWVAIPRVLVLDRRESTLAVWKVEVEDAFAESGWAAAEGDRDGEDVVRLEGEPSWMPAVTEKRLDMAWSDVREDRYCEQSNYSC